MGRKSKYSKELKIEICKKYIDGNGSTISLAKEIGTTDSVICRWIRKFKAFGESAFEARPSNNSYTKEFKLRVINDYLGGEYSINDLAIEYGIPSSSTVRNWIKLYNSHIEPEDYIPGRKDIYMTKCRKVSKEEKLEIVKYCIDHDLDYQQTCKTYDVTYPNLYNWVKKYRENGEEGLTD